MLNNFAFGGEKVWLRNDIWQKLRMINGKSQEECGIYGKGQEG